MLLTYYFFLLGHKDYNACYRQLERSLTPFKRTPHRISIVRPAIFSYFCEITFTLYAHINPNYYIAFV